MTELLKGLFILLLCFVGFSWACFIIGAVLVFGAKLLSECWKYATDSKIN